MRNQNTLQTLFLSIFLLFSFGAKAQLYYFFDHKNNTKEIINFIETPLGVEIMFKTAHTAKWENIQIIKSPPALGGTYLIETPNKIKYQLTPTLVNLKSRIVLKNLKTGKTKNFLQKTIYIFRGDNTEYLEQVNIDETGKLLNDDVWIWVKKGVSTKFTSTLNKADYPTEYTLNSPNEKGKYKLNQIDNNIESVNSFELTTPKGEKKVFFVETVKYE